MPSSDLTFTLYYLRANWAESKQKCEAIGQNLVVMDTLNKSLAVISTV